MDIQQSNIMHMAKIALLQPRLEHHRMATESGCFSRKSCDTLPPPVEVQDWMITVYEVEFGPQSSEGLYVSSIEDECEEQV
jgi:hypothetical protein